MSMPVNNIQPKGLAALPLALLIMLSGAVIWQLTQTEPLAITRRLAVHHALQNIPEAEIKERLKELMPEHLFTGKDPFFRGPTPAPTSRATTGKEVTANLQDIHLTTIAQGKSGRYCLINGNFYTEGSQGEGFKVDYIETDYVVFSTPFQTFQLSPGQKISLADGKILTPINGK